MTTSLTLSKQLLALIISGSTTEQGSASLNYCVSPRLFPSDRVLSQATYPELSSYSGKPPIQYSTLKTKDGHAMKLRANGFSWDTLVSGLLSQSPLLVEYSFA